MFGFVFPGQGSQQPLMGKFLFDNFKEAKDVFHEASSSIDLDLAKLCFEGTTDQLSLTENTQPAIVTVSVATHRVLKAKLGLSPVLVAGHSVGEYSALVAAEVISLKDAIQSVRLRGQAMQSAVPVGKGAMAAVMGLEDAQVEQLCKLATEKSGAPVTVANYNSPGQIVISGSSLAFDWLHQQDIPSILPGVKRCKLIPLQVSAPFHCPMMEPAEKKMREHLNLVQFSDAKIPVVQNYTARLHRTSSEIKENLIRQISAPVKWTHSMLEFKSQNVLRCIECGHGKVLQGLLKKIDSDKFQVFNVNSLEDIETIEKFKNSLST